MPELINPLAGYRDAYNLLEGQAQDGARRQAGNALAGGNYQGAQDALYGRGMLDEGLAVQQRQFGVQDREMGQQAAQAEAEKKASGERAQQAIGILTRMKTLPPEQLDGAYQSFLRPFLEQTLTPEMMAQVDAAPKTPENVDLLLTAMGAEAEKLQMFNLGGDRGVVAFDARGQRVEGAGYQPEPEPDRMRGPNGIFERDPETGEWEMVQPFGPAPRQPPRPRASSGAGTVGSRGRVFSDLPPGAQVE
jgi:hypothetical protein